MSDRRQATRKPGIRKKRPGDGRKPLSRETEVAAQRPPKLSNSRLGFARFEWNVVRLDYNSDPILASQELHALANTKPPDDSPLRDRLVLISPGVDIFASNIPKNWHGEIFDAIEESPSWMFLVITRNPKALLDVSIPDNCGVGFRVLGQHDLNIALRVFRTLKKHDCKPVVTCLLLDVIDDVYEIETTPNGSLLEYVDWLILRHATWTPRNPVAIEKLYIEAREAQCALYVQDSAAVQPRELPYSIEAFFTGDENGNLEGETDDLEVEDLGEADSSEDDDDLEMDDADFDEEDDDEE